ncbi:lef-3 [Tomelloso virus]|uniref:Lef-3 n=1 Tax=Tomelloso virus TaxID=2053981 RepID=A0A2H4T2Y7_9VIRU|nr:lef-3 [Tomelloso virus]ATY70248.1 lef-3 [Tomelloso virus]
MNCVKTMDHKMVRQTLDPRVRNKRQINVVYWQMSFSKNDRRAVSALYFKSNDGHRLFSLNRNNVPIQCWSDISGISTIKSSLVATDRFNQLLEKIKPKILYLNDGEHLDTSKYAIHLFHEHSLLDFLKSIEIVDPQANVSKCTRPTFKTLKELDPTMSKKEYRKIIEAWD